MPLSDHLNARYDQANIRCLLQLHFKPLPLNLTQHGFLRVSIGQVTLFAWGISLIGDFGARFKPACVKENHLNTLPYRPKLIGVVETLSLPSQIVGRQLPKIHEGIFGHLFVWRLGATVDQLQRLPKLCQAARTPGCISATASMSVTLTSVAFISASMR